MKKKRRWGRIIVLSVLGVLLIAIAGTGKVLYDKVMAEQDSLYAERDEMKEHLMNSAEALMAQDTATASSEMDQALAMDQQIRDHVSSDFLMKLRKISKVEDKVQNALEMLDLVEYTNEEIFQPAINQLNNNPISNLKLEDGYNVRLVLSYLDFADEVMPKAAEVSTRLNDLGDLSEMDEEGKIEEYQGKLNEISAKYEEMSKYYKVLRAVLGDGETDRTYAIMAQNSAEMRAGGGFVGSVGEINIYDGVLHVENFKSVLYAMLDGVYGDPITYTENTLFDGKMGMMVGATFDPDFTRAGALLAGQYNARNGKDIDGVISMTPAMIQKVLALCGEVELFNGTVLNGDNATKYLQHDVYYEYLDGNKADNYEYWGALCDQVFNDTASATLSMFGGNISMDNLDDYVNLFVDSGKDRTVMLWMKVEAEEQLVKDAGFSGALNLGVNNAENGIYISIARDASKKGWWLNWDPEITGKTENEDGTVTYDVQVIFSNEITEEEIQKGSHYITGINYGRSIRQEMYFFAPVGGDITDCTIDDGSYILEDTYMDRKVCYVTTQVWKDNPVTVNYKITVSADVQDELSFDMTPSLSPYREAAE